MSWYLQRNVRNQRFHPKHIQKKPSRYSIFLWKVNRSAHGRKWFVQGTKSKEKSQMSLQKWSKWRPIMEKIMWMGVHGWTMETSRSNGQQYHMQTKRIQTILYCCQIKPRWRPLLPSISQKWCRLEALERWSYQNYPEWSNHCHHAKRNKNIQTLSFNGWRRCRKWRF